MNGKVMPEETEKAIKVTPEEAERAIKVTPEEAEKSISINQECASFVVIGDEAYTSEIIEEYNRNAEAKTEIFNTNAEGKTLSYNDNAANKMEAFDNNYDNKVDTFNSNANTHIEEFNAHALTQINNFNDNASSAIDDYNLNAEQKINEFMSSLPIASKDALGCIKVGANLTIEEDGTLNATASSGGIVEETDPVFSASASANITSQDITNWNNKSEFDGAYSSLTGTPIIPTKTSELTNDSSFASESYVANAIENAQQGYATIDDLNNKVDKVVGKSLISDSEIERLANIANYDDTEIKNILNNKADMSAIPTKVSQLTNDAGYLTEHQDISNLATKDELHFHENKSVLDSITQESIDSWNNGTGGGNGEVLPIGTMIPYGSQNNIPTNWRICDGSEVSRTDYAELFNIIGTSYGEGDGTTTFNLPNKKGRISVGLDVDQSEFNSIGKKSGSKYMQKHSHKLGAEGAWYYGASTANLDGTGTWAYRAYETNEAGEGDSGNLQPYEVDVWIIKVSNLVGMLDTKNANVIDNLTSTSRTDALSANMGRELKDKIDKIGGIDKSQLLDLVYPIGSLYMSMNETDPKDLFGGTWERIKDRFIYANGDATASGVTGGSAVHNHGLGSGFAAMNIGDGGIQYQEKQVGGWGTNAAMNIGTSYDSYQTKSWGISLGGATDNGNNIPPYITAYIWKRTA